MASFSDLTASLRSLQSTFATTDLFRYLGIATASYTALQITGIAYRFLKPSALSRSLKRDKDCWAIVTGASDGIGKGFAQDLARRGFHVILHGRNRQKLEGVARELVKEFPKVQTRIFVADASSPDASVSFPILLDMIKDLHVTVLINNVGGGGAGEKELAYTQDRETGQIDNLINLNAGFTTKITGALLPTLMKNQPSVILNIGSLASLGLPLLAVYAGTKGYLNSFSEALQNDLIKSGHDVTVHAVLVGAVESPGSQNKYDVFTPRAGDFARATLGRVGKAPVNMIGYWRHALQLWPLQFLPYGTMQSVFISTMTKLEQERIKAK